MWHQPGRSAVVPCVEWSFSECDYSFTSDNILMITSGLELSSVTWAYPWVTATIRERKNVQKEQGRYCAPPNCRAVLSSETKWEEKRKRRGALFPSAFSPTIPTQEPGTGLLAWPMRHWLRITPDSDYLHVCLNCSSPKECTKHQGMVTSAE